MTEKIIQINSTNQVRIKVVNFNGRYRLDIRHFYSEDAAHPDFKPTRKGINIAAEMGSDLRAAIDAVLAEFASASDAQEQRQDY